MKDLKSGLACFYMKRDLTHFRYDKWVRDCVPLVKFVITKLVRKKTFEVVISGL